MPLLLWVAIVVCSTAEASIMERSSDRVSDEKDPGLGGDRTVECEFFDQSCARAREQGEDISSCFGSKRCLDEADKEDGGGGPEMEAFCYTVWQNGTGLPGAWNIKKQGCLFNHGSSQVGSFFMLSQKPHPHHCHNPRQSL
jgi:hypothetical protein